MASVAIEPALLERDAGLPGKLSKAIRSHGVILRALGQSVAISPPLIITVEEIGIVAEAIEAGLDDVAATLDDVPAQLAAR
jgi:adenosylmethionine-8-amino-7-oxononanoate aminotransferase